MQTAFNFSASELAHNQAGQLSSQQNKAVEDYLAAARKRTLFAAAVVLASPLLILGLLAMSEQADTLRAVLPIWLPALAVYLGIASIGFALGQRHVRQLARREVLSVQGSPVLSSVKVRGWTAYYMNLPGARFQLQPEQYRAIHEARQYRLFYLRYHPTHWILSIQEL